MKVYPILFDADVSLAGKIKYIHSNKNTSSNAFDINEKKAVQILLPRCLGVVSLYLQLFDESCNNLIFEQRAIWSGLENGADCYDVELDISKGVGLYFFKLRLVLPTCEVFGIREGKTVRLVKNTMGSPLFQITIHDYITDNPSLYQGGVIYHIFVDRFNRGGKYEKRTGSVYVNDWSQGIPEYPEYPGAPLKNNTFYGGTLWGIIDKLDYISSLGVNLIYLSPIFEAVSNHKYDTADYMTVDKAFGGDEALASLITEAQKHGIGIILDGVFNHTGSDSIYFNREDTYPVVGAFQSKSSKYYQWYEFQDYPNQYTCWWNIDILPRINPDISSCRSFFVGENGVINKYAKMGIQGFRLDVVDELSDDFVSAIKQRLNFTNPNSILYGEVWEDASNKIAYGKRKQYYLGKELDGVMNYPIRKGIISYLTQYDTTDLEYALSDIIDNAPERVKNLQMNLLGTHDTERILTLLGGESSAGRSNSYLAKKRMNDVERGTAKRRLRMAYTILSTIPGIPVIFYGDETSLEGYHDPFNRMPYPWHMQDSKMIDFYCTLGRIRREHSVYKDGNFTVKHISSDLLIYTREKGESIYTTVVNNSKHSRSISFSAPTKALISKATICNACEYDLPPFFAEIFISERECEITV